MKQLLLCFLLQTSNESEPNFAEELAKRLGTVRQAQKPVAVDETSESSINRFKGMLTPSSQKYKSYTKYFRS